jgi:hypothetical protein
MEYVSADIGVPQVKRRVFESFDQFMEAVLTEQVQLPFNSTSSLGFILTNRENNEKIKVETPAYYRARLLKGNCPNINYRILEILLLDGMTMGPNSDEFVSYFPQYETNFQQMLVSYEQLARAYFSIMTRNSQQRLTSKVERHTLDELSMRAHFDITDKSRKFTLDDVLNYLRTLHVRRLAFLMHVPYVISHHKMAPRRNFRQKRN